MDRPSRSELLKDLESDAEEYFSGGRLNNIWDIVLTIAGVVGSLLAAILAAAGAAKWLIAAFAGIPAACATAQRAVDTRSRAAWYFQRAAQTRAIALELAYDPNPNLHLYANKLAELEVSMEARWLSKSDRVNPPIDGTDSDHSPGNSRPSPSESEADSEPT